MTNLYNPIQTLIHEIGHYVARELNKEIYDIGDGVEKMFVVGKENILKMDCLGGTIAKKPKNHIEDYKIRNVTQFIAVLIYGCIFQTLYQKINSDTKLCDCFSVLNNGNGYDDFYKFRSLEKYISSPKRKEIVEYTEDTYVSLLNKNIEDFNEIF